MNYSKEHIQRLAYGELTTEELERAVVALEGFQTEFSDRWINGFFGWDEYKRGLEGIVSQAWIEEHFKTGSLPVLDLIAAWENWSLIRGCHGAAKLRKRWKRGFKSDGVTSEIYVAAQLMRAGAQVELEPRTDAGRMADCRFQLDDAQSWAYVEVSQRGFPEDSYANIRAKEIREKIARTAASVIPELLVTVALLREPDDAEVEKIVSHLKTIDKYDETQLDDLAVIFVGSPGQGFPGELKKVSQLIPGPMCFSTYCGETGLGITWLSIRDDMREKILCKELAQLPNDSPGIVAIDTSRVVGFDWLTGLAREIFDDERSIRISALAFFRSLYAREGMRTETAIHFNPRAGRPFLSHWVNELKSIF